MNTKATAGMLVLSENGRFVHIARNESRTICGKDIDRIYPRQDTSPDCRVCTRKGPR